MKKLSENLKNVLKISTGSVVGQLIGILTMPIVTRIYGAEVMGIWAIITSMSNVLTAVADLGMTSSVMVEMDRDLKTTYSVIIVISWIITTLSMPIVFAYNWLFSRQTLKNSVVISMFVAIYTIMSNRNALFTMLVNREKAYSVSMKNALILNGSAALISIVLGLLDMKAYGYHIGMTCGLILAQFYMRVHVQNLWKATQFRDIVEVFRRNRDYIKYQMGTNACYQLKMQLPNILIGALWGNTVLGYYSISQKLLNIPVTFIGQSLGTVFFQRSAEMVRKGENIADFFYRNIKRALQLAAIPMMLLAAYGDAAITMFFGREYAVGGIIVRIVVFRSFFTFISTATRGIDIVLHKQKLAFVENVIQTAAVAVCVYISYWLTGDILVCALLIAVVIGLIEAVYHCILLKFLQFPARKYVRDIIIALPVILVMSLLIRYGFIWITDLTKWGPFQFLKAFMVL